MDVQAHDGKDKIMPDYKTYPLGIDVSFYQQTNDWAKVSNLAKFAFIRAGQNAMVDSKFALNWASSKGKLPRGAYWFYDWRSTGNTPEAQGKLFANIVYEPGEIPMVMDFEKPYKDWTPEPFPARDTALAIIRRFKDAVGAERMILYMNQSTLKGLQPFPSWLTDEFDLWIAAYFYQPGTTNLMTSTAQIPATWAPNTYGWKYKFWQFTSKLDGTSYGVGSLDLDGDLFNGTAQELADYCNTGEITDAEKLRRLWEAHPELWDA